MKIQIILGNHLSFVFGVTIFSTSISLLIISLQFFTIFVTFESPSVSLLLLIFCVSSYAQLAFIYTKAETAKMKVKRTHSIV